MREKKIAESFVYKWMQPHKSISNHFHRSARKGLGFSCVSGKQFRSSQFFTPFFHPVITGFELNHRGLELKIGTDLGRIIATTDNTVANHPNSSLPPLTAACSGSVMLPVKRNLPPFFLVLQEGG